ncbi:MAG: hypothetical protein HC913_07095 [Microscillaceae bacterium]|nr:hypothetical protein [Microscillaceae bacterium]
MIPVILFGLIIKLSGAGLFLLLVFWFLKHIRYKAWPFVSYLSLLSAFYVVPYLVHNVILTGYPISPLSLFDFFEVDWKMPQQTDKSGLIDIGYLLEPFTTGITHHRITEFNSQSGLSIMNKDRLTWLEWIRYTVFTFDFHDWLWLFLAIFSTVNMLVTFRKFNFYTLPIEVKTTLIINLFLWLMVLPSWLFGGIRIVHGYWIFIITFGTALIMSWCMSKMAKRFYPLLFYFGVLFVAKNIFNVENSNNILSQHLLFPPSFPVMEDTIPIKIAPSIFIKITTILQKIKI